MAVWAVKASAYKLDKQLESEIKEEVEPSFGG
jgi:hypothetical protein